MNVAEVHHARRLVPSDVQTRVLAALAHSSAPVRSGELEKRTGLFAGELRSACVWLSDNGYVDRALRMLKVQAGGGSVRKRLAFYSLTEKGRNYSAQIR